MPGGGEGRNTLRLSALPLAAVNGLASIVAPIGAAIATERPKTAA